MYSDETLDEKINFSVKRVEVFRRNPGNLETDADVDNYLKNFCQVTRSPRTISGFLSKAPVYTSVKLALSNLEALSQNWQLLLLSDSVKVLE